MVQSARLVSRRMWSAASIRFSVQLPQAFFFLHSAQAVFIQRLSCSVLSWLPISSATPAPSTAAAWFCSGATTSTAPLPTSSLPTRSWRIMAWAYSSAVLPSKSLTSRVTISTPVFSAWSRICFSNCARMAGSRIPNSS